MTAVLERPAPAPITDDPEGFEHLYRLADLPCPAFCGYVPPDFSKLAMHTDKPKCPTCLQLAST